MIGSLLLSSAMAWTCPEAAHVYTHALTESDGSRRIRDQWVYTAEQRTCLHEGGLPREVVSELRAPHGLPVSVTREQDIATVVVDNQCGSVRVNGGPAGRLVVEGWAAGEEPQIVGEAETLSIRHPSDKCASLTVTAPAESRLLVFQRSGPVWVYGMEGPVEVTAARGPVRIIGPTPLVEVESMKGDVYVDTMGSVDIEAGTGSLFVATGPGGSVKASNVLGGQFIWGGPLRRLDAESVDGPIRSVASLLPAAVVEARSHRGDVLIAVSKAQAMFLRETRGETPPLFRTLSHSTSMRPDRQGSRWTVAAFRDLPVEVRPLWFREGGQLVPSIGAKVTANQPLGTEEVRVIVNSLEGTAATVVVDTPTPRAVGALTPLLQGLQPTLGACRADLAEVVMPGNVQTWATLEVRDDKVVSFALSEEGFDPALVQCLERVTKKWSLPEAGDLTLEWPLSLLRSRDGGAPSNPRGPTEP